MLTWDVIALNGYLLLNLHICGYLIYCAVQSRRKPTKGFYIPFVFVAIVWAISIHTVDGVPVLRAWAGGPSGTRRSSRRGSSRRPSRRARRSSS